MMPARYTSIGGQAVIEGVMMRSPRFVSVAVRRPDGKIALRSKPYRSLAKRFPVLSKPVLRGVVVLVESLIQGLEALSFSAEVASPEESGEGSSWGIALSLALAFVLGVGLFVALPHGLTVVVGGWLPSAGLSVDSPGFHLLDGVFKTGILLAYVRGIAFMKDIHRVFQYHGAEHKSIYAFEAGQELTVENARGQSRLHPRCGTSFLLFLVLISILAFSAVFPALGFSSIGGGGIRAHAAMVVAKVFLMFPVAGFSYELIKWSASRMSNPLLRAVVLPGLWLQNLTTREPDDDQLEVALASLRQALLLEKGAGAEGDRDLARLADLPLAAALVAEFPEA